MHGASWHKDHISWCHRLLVDQFFQAYCLDRLLDLLAGAGRCKSMDDPGSRPGIENIPELGLARLALFLAGSVVIVRMDLQRELRVGIDKLGQRGKRWPKTAMALSPRSETPSSCTSSPSVLPVYRPFCTRVLISVSQASPIGA
jgi:hypothetical protein